MNGTEHKTLSVRAGSRKKVGIVRGPGLSKWEMRIYEPLEEWFDLTGIGSTRPGNDVSGITFPVKKLICPAQYFYWLPKLIPILYSTAGDTQWLLNFSQAVQGMRLLHAVELRNGYSLQAVRAKQAGLVEAVTLTVYENIPFTGDGYPRRKRIKEEVLAGVDHFLAANEMARQALLLEGASDERISVVSQSVDTHRFTPIHTSKTQHQKFRKQLGIGNNDYVVLSIGRMVWEKGWEDLLAAARRIFNVQGSMIKKRNVRFLCVGEGPTLGRYRELVVQLGLEKSVLFPGGIAYRDMPDIFRLADVFVYASLPTSVWNAQFGGVLIEAMATGLPIVGTLSGGTRDDTVGRDGGIFVQPQHFSRLADAILKLYREPGLGKNIGRRNRSVATRQYDTLVVAGQIKHIWEKVMS